MQPRVSTRKHATVLSPKTPAQRDYLAKWNVSGDVLYGADCIDRQAESLLRIARGDADAVAAVANMRRCARRLVLLARSLKREVVRG